MIRSTTANSHIASATTRGALYGYNDDVWLRGLEHLEMAACEALLAFRPSETSSHRPHMSTLADLRNSRPQSPLAHWHALWRLAPCRAMQSTSQGNRSARVERVVADTVRRNSRPPNAAYRPRRKPISAALTSAGRSCWVQSPQPGSMIASRICETCFAILSSRSRPTNATAMSRSPVM